MSDVYSEQNFDAIFAMSDDAPASDVAAFEEFINDMWGPDEVQQVLSPASITTSTTTPSSATHGQHDLVIDHAEPPLDCPTIGDLQEEIADMRRQNEQEMAKLRAEHAAEMEAMRRKNKILTTRLEQFSKGLTHKITQPMGPHGGPDLIQRMWSSETSEEQRRAMVQGLPEPPLYRAPASKKRLSVSPPYGTSRAAAMVAYGQPTYPPGVVFNGTSAYAPAMGSSPLPLSTTPISSSPPGPKAKVKTRAPAPAKRTPVSTKVTKPTAAKRKSPTSSPTSFSPAAVRSLEELYAVHFDTLSHEEKCRLVIPLLHGVDSVMLGNVTTSSSPYGSSLSGEKTSFPPLPRARSPRDLAMVQQAVEELGPGAVGGATRQHEALQRTDVRRR
ncbi:hypothetical protein IAQ61_011903 [Plenodomus lingam]|uniref:Predicted protein n=1 Tax=Leptosphaeria maculans (strain JN3 / isolate v23.1.3 / race Av1-4-5-6-7-8) TaxID=985895 RepID=E5ABG3_LEPMJ|nr:predicted protein [Plenodomus lingam JN3]KAH9860119.1 hypothetical protein IAQ61_011903 [Plenodomus lingam]CBY01004.1 predicted protein [Plenodomus lingam JN3]